MNEKNTHPIDFVPKRKQKRLSDKWLYSYCDNSARDGEKEREEGEKCEK